MRNKENCRVSGAFSNKNALKSKNKIDIFNTTIALLKTIPDATILDIGANIGIFSFFAVRHKYNCHSFEPHPYYFEILNRRLSLLRLEKRIKLFNQIGRLHIWNLALTDRKMRTKLYHHDKKPGSHSIIKGKVESEGGKENPKKFDVSTNTIDRWIKEFIKKNDINKIKLIKIDVEGVEAEVIKGGISFLNEVKPHIIIEVRGGLVDMRRNTLKECVELLAPLGYNLYTDSCIPSSVSEIKNGKYPLFRHANVLFSPKNDIEIDKCFTENSNLTRKDKTLRLIKRIMKFNLSDLTSFAIKDSSNTLS